MPERQIRDSPLLEGDSAPTFLYLVKRLERRHQLLNGFLLLAVGVLAVALVLSRKNPHKCQHAVAATTDGAPAGEWRREFKHRVIPNAHLTGSQSRSNSSDYLTWEPQLGDAHLHLFAYDEARRALVVPRDGRYSVYLHVTYRAHDTFECGDSVELEQHVFVWSDRYRHDVLLLRGRESVGCGEGTWVKSLYTASVFSLSDGDRLMVKVSPVELVDLHEKSLFFGAFLVAPESEEE
ncbi:lymphotoxin-alpha-like [Arapaima gigas]